MDSEDEGGFLQAQYSRPGQLPLTSSQYSNPSTAGNSPYGHVVEEPLYARPAPKAAWGQRRGFSEPGTKAPRPWHPQSKTSGTFLPQFVQTPTNHARLPAPQPFLAASGASAVGLPGVSGLPGVGGLPGVSGGFGAGADPHHQPVAQGHFGVDTEMIEERWIHMQEARRRQQLNTDHLGPRGAGGHGAPGGSGGPSAHHPAHGGHGHGHHAEQLAATYSPESARQIYIQRKDGGFGFTLRHFIVYPPEEGDTSGPPISEPMDTIFVKFIKEGGPATLAGLQVGDRLISVNGESVAGLTYAQVVQLIQNTKGMLRLVVVPEKDDILQVYFSEIAQDPKTNTRIEPSGSVIPGSSSGAAVANLLGSGSSRDSSPFSSKASSDRYGGGAAGHSVGAARYDHEPLYESVGGGPSCGGSTEHVYATPAMAGGSSVSTLGSGGGGLGKPGSHVLSSKDSLNSESSLSIANIPSQQDDQMIDKIKKDCEKKKEFLEKPVYPSYLSSGGGQPPVNLSAAGVGTQQQQPAAGAGAQQQPSLSSPPKDVDANPYGIASLANTMPPPRDDKKDSKEETSAPATMATKNFFMDIYAKEVSKMQSASKSSAATKKRNFDATQFNTYGRPLEAGGPTQDQDTNTQNKEETNEPRRLSLPGGLAKLDLMPKYIKNPFDLGRSKEPQASVPASRSPSADPDQGSSSTFDSSKDDKTFSVTMFVNENEKNKIVDMIHKAKSLISRKVEKVIGRRPPRGEVTNVEALQTVLETWVHDEEKAAKKEDEEERQLIAEQENQVTSMRAKGQNPPVNYTPIPDVSVEDSDETDTITECSLVSDMEVKRIGGRDRNVRSPSLLYPRPSPTPSLTPTGDLVPCPWRLKSDNELYPPRLRRPSSHYGAEAAAASSRPPSRQCSLSPSFCSSPVSIDHSEVIEEEPVDRSKNTTSAPPPERNVEQPHGSGSGMSDEERRLQKEVEDTFRQYIRYCRPDSYLVPIGGVWKPDHDKEVDESEYVKPRTGEDLDKDKPKAFRAAAKKGSRRCSRDSSRRSSQAGPVATAADQAGVGGDHGARDKDDDSQGYRGGGGGPFYETDSFSRNNFVIIGTRSLHCEPPDTYERPPEPQPAVCEGCYECQQQAVVYPYTTPPGGVAATSVPAPYCPLCVPVHSLPPGGGVGGSVAVGGCVQCAAAAAVSMTMSHHHPPAYHHHHHNHHPTPPPPPTRPCTLPGLKGHDGGPRDSPPVVAAVLPTQSTPVHMHPDPSTVYTRQDPTITPSPLYDNREVVYRKTSFRHESDVDRNLRRVSYLQATKDERMDTEENETGIAPTHSIKKLKSIFSEKSGGGGGEPPPPTSTAGVVGGGGGGAPLTLKMGEGSGEVTPISAASPKRKPSFEKAGSVTSMLTDGGGLKEGYLHCKVAVLDGKRANDRSWKTVYAILKSKALYMYKDKKTAQENLEEFEEKPVKLAESEVEVANDYTKRKNVFRVKTEQGSEYLFQAENELIMKDWVKTIDEAAMAVIIDERKDNKLKKLASFRNRSPTAGQSPASKPRKPSGESLQQPALVNKDKKNWKGKMVKQLKRMGGGGGQGGPPAYPEGGSICVPLEECPLASDYTDTDLIIPYLVKICCDIVTERGLEIVGIYRVPGNNAAVNYLTEQINRGVPFYQLDDSRWQDVNVVSSLLKMFFRKLPDPLFTMDMYSTFIEASKIEQPNKRLEHLRRLVRDLPEIHQETLKFLTKHLCNVADNSTTNKMEIRNLAIVFGPTLVRTTDDNMVTMVTDMSQQCRIIESLLSNWEYFFADTEVELEVRDSDVTEASMEVTGTSNHQSVMLANLHKLEDAGKLSSPKGDVSAKDIVSSIISAANRKIKKTGKKESSGTDLDELANLSSQSRHDELSDSRRDSESVIHGALQIASAVPGLLGPFSAQSLTSSSRGCSSPPTPSEDSTKTFSSRRGSRDSYSGGNDGLKRRGSLPAAPQSKRGSIGSYSAMVTSSNSGSDLAGAASSSREQSGTRTELHGCDNMMEHEEAEPVIIQSDTEAIRNGMDENQVIRGTLSLVNMNSSKRETSEEHQQYKYPFETYTGLQEAQSQRIKQFEAETKAMIHRSVEQSSSRTSINEHVNTRLDDSYTMPPTNPMVTCSYSPSLPQSRGHQHQPRDLHHHQQHQHQHNHQRSYSTPHLLSSITTPVPDTDPLTGGILLEEHYHTDAYDRVGGVGVEATYLPQYRANTISSMLTMDEEAAAQQPLPAEILQAFDTNKVVKRGTLQRLKVRRTDSHEGPSVETVMESSDREELEMEKDALCQLSASFDKKLKFLLDPGPSSLRSAQYSTPEEPAQPSSLQQSEVNSDVESLSQDQEQPPATSDSGQAGLDDDFLDQLCEFAANPGSKKELDDVKNSLLRNKKVKRTGRVDKNNEPELRRVGNKPTGGSGGAAANSANATASKSQLVLRQINNRKPLKRSDSLTKKEKTELNLKTKEVEKENKVMKLKEQFEAASMLQSQSGNGNGGTGGSTLPALISQPAVLNKLDVNKIRKKLSDSRNNRIKRRHTVGGTKDFPDKLMNRVNSSSGGQDTAAVGAGALSCWDRLTPALSVQEVMAKNNNNHAKNNNTEDVLMISEHHFRLEDSEERRLSLPDYGRLIDNDQPIESHV